MAAIRRNVLFKSSSFNTTDSKPYFINEGCFGDDLGWWFLKELQSRGLKTDPEPGQEDFGWYVRFRMGKIEYDWVIDYRLGESEGQPGDWLCTLERRSGLVGSVLGARKRGIDPEALRTVHSILERAPIISDIRWLADEDMRLEQNSKPRPIDD